jgi:hypothetical protein
MPGAPGADGWPLHAAALPLWRRKWNRDEYWRLVELGMIHEGSGTELLDGDIVEVAPQSNLHAAGMSLTHDALRAAFGADYWVRIGATLDLGPWSQPDPDLSVVRCSPREATRTVATSALLVVEISDSTLSHDRGFKASLYATGGIADYWVVNLVQRRLEVRRDPQPDPTQFFGHGYGTLTTFAPGDRVSPLAAPQASVAVDDLLP